MVYGEDLDGSRNGGEIKREGREEDRRDIRQ